MQGHFRQLVEPRRVILSLFALTFAVVFAVALVDGVLQAASFGLPAIPHELAGREQCLGCHSANGIRPVPANHEGRADASCTSCHMAETPTSATVTPAKSSTEEEDSNCIACHQAKMNFTFPNGEVIDVAIEQKDYSASVHGGLSCLACHGDKTAGYPHSKLSVVDRRTYTTTEAQKCETCHQNAANAMESSVHGEALTSGNTNAATCTDCHGVHNVSSAERLDRRPKLCSSCHSVVTQTYQDSIHGQLLASGRTDAATCLDCHTRDRSGHTIARLNDAEGPTADKNVPATCGQCHRHALETYNTTFHGRAMRLGVKGNAPNCVDCHGAYGVQRVHASEAPVDETRFASACAKCHEGAGENFASGWMGHEEASPDWFPAVFITERFLFFLTTSVVAFGILHVELDILRWLVRRRREGKCGNGREAGNDNEGR